MSFMVKISTQHYEPRYVKYSDMLYMYVIVKEQDKNILPKLYAKLARNIKKPPLTE